ncbi:zinc ABC transporter ATP-binding protein AztA [Microbacterium sp. 77mftsu3.1]|uniref:zinc ABC transporter ATP-binding protein AztA n=1 Tax=Microbacterium sp. 77mftsu3.1 TaxID=1761802 RepID=UPI0003677862|nr:zinc ABC transporter ATP-binding protein AztA [Microbacterium sp. 77mftsu3.1]SDG91315.1 zinc/manganese transport system ATP-binding protein [Microbacterium sp. 77mftsu3.1]
MHSSRVVVRLGEVCVDIDGHRALDGVDLDVRAGVLTAVVGANGSGKSTLVSVLAGLRAPTSGTVEMRPGTAIALVPQHTADTARLPLTVTDLVSMGRWRERGAFRPLRRRDRERVAEAIDAVGLRPYSSRPLGALSGGQRQRAFVGQALAQDADLLLLDEPTSGLDDASRRAAASALRVAADRGAAVVVVTHDLGELGDVDDVVTLAAGRIVGAPTAYDTRGRRGRNVSSVEG